MLDTNKKDQSESHMYLIRPKYIMFVTLKTKIKQEQFEEQKCLIFST